MKIAVRVPNWIGDAVLSLPALSALKAAHPGAEVWVVARDWVKDLFSSGTPADGVVVLPDDSSLAGVRKAARRLREERFDAGLLLTNSFGSALALALARIPQRWGYKRDGRGPLLTRGVRLDEAAAPVHQAEYYLRLVRGLGFETPPSPIRIGLTAAETKAGLDLLRSAGVKADKRKPVVLINPGASYGPAKRWPVERFARLASRLQETRSAQIVVTGAPGEAPIAAAMASAMERPPVVLAGKTALRGLLGILSQARLFITNDSGPMHMANALGVPVVGLFGPTDPAATRPYQPPSTVIWKGAACWPCLYRACPFDHRCMTAIAPEEVLEAAEAYLR
jgi:heptosyltransferase-2